MTAATAQKAARAEVRDRRHAHAEQQAAAAEEARLHLSAAEELDLESVAMPAHISGAGQDHSLRGSTLDACTRLGVLKLRCSWSSACASFGGNE